MFEWFLMKYFMLQINWNIFLNNPGNTPVITVLKIASFLLFAYFCAKCIIHSFIFIRLRKQHNVIKQHHEPGFYRLVRKLAGEIGLEKIPALFYFSDKKPLIFTIGIFRPAVFISPRILLDLNYSELTAVMTHELTHIKRNDGLYNRIMQFIPVLIPAALVLLFGRTIMMDLYTQLFWYLLTFVLLLSYRLFIYEGFNLDRETSCDDLTLKIINDPLLLAESIMKVWEAGKELPVYNWRLDLASVRPFAAGNSGYQGRVKRLVNYRKPYVKIILKKLVVLSFAAGFIPLSIFIWDYNTGRIGNGLEFIYENDKLKMTVEKVIVQKHDNDNISLRVWTVKNQLPKIVIKP
ncbi:MAG: M48 family metalloprotease [bacterium]|nr:M48 family metalloprotease [bacterium]